MKRAAYLRIILAIDKNHDKPTIRTVINKMPGFLKNLNIKNWHLLLSSGLLKHNSYRSLLHNNTHGPAKSSSYRPLK